MSDASSSGSRILEQIRAKKLDASASALSSVFVILCVFKIPDRLDITPSELGIVLGSVAAIGASLRTMFERR